ncbi:MAG: histidinol dehydrogenase [Marinilabiliales bacterium]|nr:histidinol dehydrogenase [Marinilabiliales bacterium]
MNLKKIKLFTIIPKNSTESTPGNLKVSEDEINESERLVSEKVKLSISTARENIERFHSAQLIAETLPLRLSRGYTAGEKASQ